MKLIDILIEKERIQQKFFKNYKKYFKEIKKIVKKEIGPAKVVLFGSILTKRKPKRDIDVLIISPKFKKKENKLKLKKKIYFKFGWLFPFELHLITPEEYENWYKYFIKNSS